MTESTSTSTGTGARPAGGRSLAGSLLRYRVLAYATGVFLLVLTLHVAVHAQQAISLDLPWSQAQGLGKWIPGGDTWIPAAHGWLYLAYVVASVDLWMRTRLPAGRMILVVLAGTIPVMSFVAERWVTSRLHPIIAAVVERPTPAPK
jgi:integral membrane protein